MSPAKRSNPGRALGLVLLVLAVLYGGMALSGRSAPALGLDLRGGTTVTLTPSAPNAKINKSDLNQSVDIIRQRVDGLGVSSASVSTEGNNIVIAVPGKGRADVLSLVGKTALLDFRAVTESAAATPPATPSPSASASGTSTASPTASASTSPSSTTSASPSSKTPATSAAATVAPATSGGPKSLGAPGYSGATNQQAAYALPRAASASPSTSVAAPTAAAASTGAVASPVPSPSASAVGSSSLSKPETAPTAAETAAFNAIDCNLPKNQAGGNAGDPNKYIVGCGQQSGVWVKYLLAPVLIAGTQVTNVQAGLDPQNNVTWIVNLSFKGSAIKTWATYTAANVCSAKATTPCNLVAVVLDGVVVSAEQISSAIPDGNTEISGSFTHKTASQLAQVLKYGSLKIAFKTQTAEDISATLGNRQLTAGLLAGAIGLGLVLLYSFFYYRGLSLVTVISLALSAALQYPMIVILGKTIGYTLSLAGIAGLIVAVGITADSFVVFFERLRDEVRDGNSLRSAVEKAWPRARRTILSADLVSLLAAGVLYWRAVGDVKGFAFTLGLSTATDLFIVFFFTKPMITLLARTAFYGGGHRMSGLDPARLGVKTLTGRVEVRRRPGLGGPGVTREEGA